MNNNQTETVSTELLEITALDLAERLKGGAVRLIDVREHDEFAYEKIPSARSIPLSGFDAAALDQKEADSLVLYCQRGNRSKQAAAALQAAGWRRVTHLAGGLYAWQESGLAVERERKVLPIMRQVQICAGGMVLLGLVLGWLAHPMFNLISALAGGGLVFAGVSGWCGLALLLQKMPWNRSLEQRGASCGL